MKKVLTGIKTNNEKVWTGLYNDLMPLAINHVINNSGSVDDAKDLLQNTFEKILLKCGKGYQHDNIKAIMIRRLKWDWLDILRSNKRKKEIESEIQASHESSSFVAIEIDKISNLKINIKKRFNLSVNYIKNLKMKCRTEDFLDYNGLNDEQKKMIEILLDMEKNNPVCKKLLLLTEFLPVNDTTIIAREMGYITEETESGRQKGRDTLKTRKKECMKKFRQYFSK